MVDLAESATSAWPLLIAIACAVAVDRRRESRRRATLNRAMHELRRPLQFLTLACSAGPAPANGSAAAIRGQLEAALWALADLDAGVNGRRRAGRRCPLRADELVGDAVERWRSPAALLGRQLELRWRAGRATVIGDRQALARALDNLVANSLEHGAERIRVEGSADRGRLRIAVVDGDGGDPDRGANAAHGPIANACSGEVGAFPAQPGDGGPRRGHGLAVVARIATGHGGRFAFVRQARRARSVLELPLAAEPAAAVDRRSPRDAA